MALKLIEGFDDGLSAARGWTPTYGASQIPSFIAGRFGGLCIQTGTYEGYYYRAPEAITGVVVSGAAIRPGSLATAWVLIDCGMVRIVMNVGGTISLRRSDNNTTIATSTASVWTVSSVWRYIEFKYNLSTGACEVRAEGATIITATLPTSSSLTTLSYGHGSSALFDDVYMLDGTGSTNNDFLGDVRVQLLLPSADGSNSGMTPSTGTSHYALVDEVTPNTTDYVSAPTAGLRDTFQFQDLPANTASVYGVELMNYARKDSTPYAGTSNVVRIGGTDYTQGAKALSASWTANGDIIAINPATGGPWTPADINAAEFGVESV